jgi:hypothetical protein
MKLAASLPALLVAAAVAVLAKQFLLRAHG